MTVSKSTKRTAHAARSRGRVALGRVRHSERLNYTVGSDGVMGRPGTASREDIGVTMPKRVKRIDDGTLLVADQLARNRLKRPCSGCRARGGVPYGIGAAPESGGRHRH